MIDLPVIKNEKNVDPLDSSSPKAVQLETAMGAAIECFAGARAVAVPRTRFAPVKTTSDLLVVWSDAYRLDEQSRFVRTRPDAPAPLVDLDSAFFKRIDQFLDRFPDGPPLASRVQLAACRGRRALRRGRADRRRRVRSGRGGRAAARGGGQHAGGLSPARAASARSLPFRHAGPGAEAPFQERRLQSPYGTRAGVAELVDAVALGATVLGRAGSSPVPGTMAIGGRRARAAWHPAAPPHSPSLLESARARCGRRERDMASDQADIDVQTEEVSSVSRALSVRVPAKRVDAVFDKTFKQLGRNARVKGFRPGKVPKGVIEKMYGPAASEEVEQQLVRETLGDAFELASVEPISEPDIDASPPARGEDFRYVARVEVRPPIALPELDGLPARKPAIDVPEDEVQVQLESMRERQAPLIELPEDTQAELGHTVNIDFVGRVEGVAFEGGEGKDLELELGSGRLIPGFEDQLVGAKSGEERTVRVTFPSDYGEASLRDKDAEFEVQVRSLRHKQLPELDDEFAKDLGEDSLETLRSKVREQMVDAREQQAKGALHQSLLDALVERTQFELPHGLVERQLENQMESLKRRFGDQVPPDVLRQELGRMREEGREQAERRVREMLLLDAVAREHDVDVADDDLTRRMDELAAQQGFDPEMFRQAAMQQGWTTQIAAELRDEKVMELLAGRAEITESSDDDG